MKIRIKSDPGRVWEVVDVEFDAVLFEYVYQVKNGLEYRTVSAPNVQPLYDEYVEWLTDAYGSKDCEPEIKAHFVPNFDIELSSLKD